MRMVISLSSIGPHIAVCLLLLSSHVLVDNWYSCQCFTAIYTGQLCSTNINREDFSKCNQDTPCCSLFKVSDRLGLQLESNAVYLYVLYKSNITIHYGYKLWYQRIIGTTSGDNIHVMINCRMKANGLLIYECIRDCILKK